MSQSHLDFLGSNNEDQHRLTPQQIAADKASKEAIFEEKKREYFDESQFKNTDDIAKVPGLVPMQKQELDVLKAQFRRADEIYIRAHPEIETIMSVFVCKLMEDKPDDPLAYAGEFFENPDLQKIIEIEQDYFFKSQESQGMPGIGSAPKLGS